MRDGYSFQDDLAARAAENERAAQRLEGKQKFARLLLFWDGEARRALIERAEYFGQSLAARIVGGRSYEENTAALRHAARHVAPAGRGPLLEAAAINEANTPDTNAEARRIEALQRADAITARIAAARQRNAERSHGIEREP